MTERQQPGGLFVVHDVALNKVKRVAIGPGVTYSQLNP